MNCFPKTIFVFLLIVGQGNQVCASTAARWVMRGLGPLNALLVGGWGVQQGYERYSLNQERENALRVFRVGLSDNDKIEMELLKNSVLDGSNMPVGKARNPRLNNVDVLFYEKPALKEPLFESVSEEAMITIMASPNLKETDWEFVPKTFNHRNEIVRGLLRRELGEIYYQNARKKAISPILCSGVVLALGRGVCKLLPRRIRGPKSLWGAGLAAVGVVAASVAQAKVAAELDWQACCVFRNEADTFGMKHAESAAELASLAAFHAREYWAAHEEFCGNVRGFAIVPLVAQQKLMDEAYVATFGKAYRSHYKQYEQFYAAAQERLQEERVHPLPTTAETEEYLAWMRKRVDNVEIRSMEKLLEKAVKAEQLRRQHEAFMEKLGMSLPGKKRPHGESPRDELPRGGR